MKIRTLAGLSVVAAIAVAVGALSQPGAGDPALAAAGCFDIDGDGEVHMFDAVMIVQYAPGGTVPPAPPQLDINKDNAISITEAVDTLYAFGTATACQGDPLSTTSLSGGALAIDANGEDTSASDPIDAKRTVPLGVPFHVTIHGTPPAGKAHAYEARLHWEEALLQLNPRNVLTNSVAPFTFFPVQSLGPADDNSGFDAYIQVADITSVVGALVTDITDSGPYYQLEFTCQAEGTATLFLDTSAPATSFAATPDVVYTVSTASALIHCGSPPAVGGVAELPDAAEAAPLAASDASRISGGVLVSVLATATGVVALGVAGWYARRRFVS